MDEEDKNDRYSPRSPLDVADSLYSIGTAYAVDKLEEMIRSGEMNNTDVAVNMATLLRNHIGKDPIKYDTLINKTMQEIMVLIQEVSGMFSMHSKGKKHKILFYLIDYDTVLPNHIKRPPTPSRDFLKEAIKVFISRQNKLFPKRIFDVGEITVEFLINNRAMLPHIVLKNNMQMNGGFQDMVMISHVPMDFHIQKYVRKFAIIETHTGKYKLPKDLGNKVFKHDHMPFCPIVHALLGDKDYIQSLLGIKEKRALYALGEKEHWEIATPSKVKADAATLGYEIPVNFE
jgi:hypothetical protein